MCLTVCVQGLCLQSSPKHVPISALSVLVPGRGWGSELLCLPKARGKKNPWEEHFGSSLFQRDQNFVSCLLSFDFCGCGLGFQILVPAKHQARVSPHKPACLSSPGVWCTLQILDVCLIAGGTLELEPGLLSTVLPSPWISPSLLFSLKTFKLPAP